jgi:hypothetical protein
MDGVEPHQAGLASGLVNTTAQVGGALGLAVLATLSATRSESLASTGHARDAALLGGYHLAFWIAAGLTVAAIVIGATLLSRRSASPMSVPDGASNLEVEPVLAGHW